MYNVPKYYCKVSIAFPAHYNVYKCIEYLKRNVRVQNVIYTHDAPLCIVCAMKRAGEHKRRHGEDKCKCVNAADVTLCIIHEYERVYTM